MIIGVDIGGNSIKAVRLDEDGRVEKKLVRPTGRGQPADIKDRLLRLVSDVAGEGRPDAVGIGICGLVDSRNARVIASGALPRLRNCKVHEKLEGLLGVPVRVYKDSIMAAYGEWQVGAAKGRDNVLIFVLGANVSGGVICDGRLLHGHTGNIGGCGHISVDPNGPICVCGNRGCVGLLGSSNGLARHYRDLTHEDKAPEEVSALVAEGDEKAMEALHQTCRCLAVALGASINLLDPELVLISGGLSTLGDTLLEPLRREIITCVFPEKLVELTIACGQLGMYAGAIGAGLYMRDHGGVA